MLLRSLPNSFGVCPTLTVLMLLSFAVAAATGDAVTRKPTPKVFTSSSTRSSVHKTPPPPMFSSVSGPMPVSSTKDTRSHSTQLILSSALPVDGSKRSRPTAAGPPAMTSHASQNSNQSSQTVDSPVILSSAAAAPVVIRSSRRTSTPSTSKIPILSSGDLFSTRSTRQRATPTTTSVRWAPVTSMAVSFESGAITHCQVQLANVYQHVLNVSGSSREVYGRELGPHIARLCRIDETRITDVSVLENPQTGLMVLRFSIHPATKSCHWGCFLNTSKVAKNLHVLVNSSAFRLSDSNLQTLYVDQLPAFYSWTDTSPCPNTTCLGGHVCDVRLTGQFYCQCANCSAQQLGRSSNNDLLALFVIPCVVVVVLLVVLILLIYRRRQNVKNKAGTKSLRDYKPAYDIETLKQQPMLATLDPSAVNQLFQSLECQLGVVFNDRSFDGASSCADPFSTVRTTSSTNVLVPEEKK